MTYPGGSTTTTAPDPYDPNRKRKAGDEEAGPSADGGADTATPVDQTKAGPEGAHWGDTPTTQQAAPQGYAGGVGGLMPPPPPVPPPPPSEFGGLKGDVESFAKNWMQSPNQYLTPLAQATRAESVARLAEGKKSGERDISEWAQQRGLLGSSYEGEQQVRLADTFQRAGQADEANLLDKITGAEAAGRAAAGAYGLDTVKAGDVMGLDRYKAALEAIQLKEAQRQFGGTHDIAQQDVNLRAKQLQDQTTLEGRSLDLQEARDMATTGLEQQKLGLSQQDIDLRAKQIQEEAKLGGRTLDLQQARDQASKELENKKLQQQGSQFEQTLTESQAGRLQQYGLSKGALDLEAQKLLQQAKSENRSLDITEARNQAEISLRAQQLQQDAKTQNRTLDLEQARDLATNEYRMSELGIDLKKLGLGQQELDLKAAGLQQQAKTEGRTLDLQAARDQVAKETQLGSLGISARELDLKAQALQQEAVASGRTLDLQAARDQAQQQLAEAQLRQEAAFQGSELAQRESQFARSLGQDEKAFAEQSRQFSLKYGEEQQARLQQNTQFEKTLAADDARAAVDTGLRTRALDLQQTGMGQEAAWKQASLDQEKELQEAALALQQQGMSQDNAYRYAALSQDAAFKTETNRLTGLGLSMDDAFHYAGLSLEQKRLDQQNSQFGQEFALKMKQATSDDDRFKLMMDTYSRAFGMGGGKMGEADAMQYIRDHWSGEGSWEEIARKTGWSKDDLEKRFNGLG